LEPVGDLVEAFAARRLGHARVHVGVLVRLAGHRGLQVGARRTDRQPGGRVARAVLQELEVAMRVAGLAFGGGAEQRRDIVLTFDVGLVGEVQVATIGLRLAGKGVLQVLLGLRSLQCHVTLLGRGSGCGRGPGGSPNPYTLTKRRVQSQYKASIRCMDKSNSASTYQRRPSRRKASSCKRQAGSARSCSTVK